MLVALPKPQHELRALLGDAWVFVLRCTGCDDIATDSRGIDELLEALGNRVQATAPVEFLCHQEQVRPYLDYFKTAIDTADAVLVLACGVGSQVVSSMLPARAVYAGCDTVPMYGFQGLTARPVDCKLCGECYLNYTGGICPLTSCPKGLLNGQCGGAQDGMCEVDHTVECAWSIIYRRLAQTGSLDVLSHVFAPRDYARIVREAPPNSEVSDDAG